MKLFVYLGLQGTSLEKQNKDNLASGLFIVVVTYLH